MVGWGRVGWEEYGIRSCCMVVREKGKVMTREARNEAATFPLVWKTGWDRLTDGSADAGMLLFIGVVGTALKLGEAI